VARSDREAWLEVHRETWTEKTVLSVSGTVAPEGEEEGGEFRTQKEKEKRGDVGESYRKMCGSNDANLIGGPENSKSEYQHPLSGIKGG